MSASGLLTAAHAAAAVLADANQAQRALERAAERLADAADSVALPEADAAALRELAASYAARAAALEPGVDAAEDASIAAWRAYEAAADAEEAA